MAYNVATTCLLIPGLGLNPGECASWVQAWGSIGAILAAIWISHWGDRRARRQQIETAIRQSRSLAATLEVVAERVLTVADKKDITEIRSVLALAEEAMIDGRRIEHEILSLEWSAAIQRMRSVGAQMISFLRTVRHEDFTVSWVGHTTQRFGQYLESVRSGTEVVRHQYPGVPVDYPK